MTCSKPYNCSVQGRETNRSGQEPIDANVAQENALPRRVPSCCSQKPVSGAPALAGLPSLTVASPRLCSPPSRPAFCFLPCFSLCGSQFKTSRKRTFGAAGFRPVWIHSESKAFARLDPRSRLLLNSEQLPWGGTDSCGQSSWSHSWLT